MKNGIELNKILVWVFTLQSSTKTKINKIKLLNGKLVIESGVMENEIKVKTKYCVDIAVVDKAQK